jgi:MarR family transcriptional regulator, 2-MHQ and catechol-resistance regulon repressor
MDEIDPTCCAVLGDLDDPRVEALGMLIETHNELLHAVSRRLDAELAIPIPWLGVLIRLARSPGQRLRMTELARDMTMSASGLTRLVDRIEQAGHVRREACPEDRRGFHAVLTDAGAEAIGRAGAGHVEDLDRYLAAPLGDGELAQLTDLLRRVRDHIRAQPAG